MWAMHHVVSSGDRHNRRGPCDAGRSETCRLLSELLRNIHFLKDWIRDSWIWFWAAQPTCVSAKIRTSSKKATRPTRFTSYDRETWLWRFLLRNGSRSSLRPLARERSWAGL